MESVQDAAESERLFALYRSPLLDRKDYIWKAQLEVSYCKQYKLLVSGMIKADMAGQEWSKAEQKLDVYLSMYPLDEEMHQLLIDIFAVSGKREQIARHYNDFEALYRRELGLEPPQEMRNKVDAYLK